MSTSVQQETGVVDKKTSLALLNRAFFAIPTPAQDDLKEEYASGILPAAADLDVRAATPVVRRLLVDKSFDLATELLVLLPGDVEYPYEAAF